MPKTLLTSTIRGFAGKNWEMRYSPNGDPITSGSIAVTRNWQQSGEWKSETTWARVTIFGKAANGDNDAAVRAAQIQKGDFVIVDDAYLMPDPATGGPKLWNANDGSPRTSYEFKASAVTNLGKPPKADEQASGGMGAPDEDIPF